MGGDVLEQRGEGSPGPRQAVSSRPSSASDWPSDDRSLAERRTHPEHPRCPGFLRRAQRRRAVWERPHKHTGSSRKRNPGLPRPPRSLAHRGRSKGNRDAVTTTAIWSITMCRFPGPLYRTGCSTRGTGSGPSVLVEGMKDGASASLRTCRVVGAAQQGAQRNPCYRRENEAAANAHLPPPNPLP